MFTFNLNNNNKYKKIHFIGIGGVSMSGIALILSKSGFIISGSDRMEGQAVDHLRDQGIEVFIGQRKENISDQDLFVYTDAILKDNEEYIAAVATGKPVVSRGVFLGALMRNYKNSIAVSGTHGKSTTTSMLTKILIDSPEDPSILLGGYLDAINGNVQVGSEDFLLTEACEFNGNILNYFPSTVIVLNIGADHLDYFKDLNHIIETFEGYMKNLDPDSKAIINIDDPNTSSLASYVKGEVITFGVENPQAIYNVVDVEYDQNGFPSFSIIMRDGSRESFKLNVMGDYNIYNASAAIIASYETGIDIDIIRKSLFSYKPLHRRLEKVGFYKDAQVLTDYGHHPVEIQSTLSTLAKYKKNKLVCVFEPHTFSRTKSLLNEFSESFFEADQVIVTDIYPAREKLDPTIHSKDLVKLLKEKGVQAEYIPTLKEEFKPDFQAVKDYLDNILEKNDTCLTTGAGFSDKLADYIVN